MQNVWNITANILQQSHPTRKNPDGRLADRSQGSEGSEGSGDERAAKEVGTRLAETFQRYPIRLTEIYHLIDQFPDDTKEELLEKFLTLSYYW